MNTPTARQQEALQFVADFVAAHGYPPTLREIGSAMGMSTVEAPRSLLMSLERKGHIVRTPSTSRGIKLVDRTLLGAARPTDPNVRG